MFTWAILHLRGCFAGGFGMPAACGGVVLAPRARVVGGPWVHRITPPQLDQGEGSFGHGG
jgi:hypothetical protein